jgi:rSAM/selenodomain-associated transferase 1
MRQGIIIFAREPLPGRVKTRLAVSVGEQAAADLYETMLLEVLEKSCALDGVEPLVYWACEEESLLRLAEKYCCNSSRQSSGDLGQRMQAAFTEMFAGGFDTCCIIGSDAPDLPLPYIKEAFGLLASRQADAVFGPCRDGGYYLLGVRQIQSQLFENISWSSGIVLEQSLAAAQEAKLTVMLLPEWQDIDTVEDLRAYRERKQLTEPMDTL